MHAFYDTKLNFLRAYLAGDWGRHTVAFSGHGCALQADIAVRDMMASLQAAHLDRRDQLVALLGERLALAEREGVWGCSARYQQPSPPSPPPRPDAPHAWHAGIDLDWRMHQLSDGQRRRVQIMLQMLRPSKMLLLDVITTDLDLITRQDFLAYLRKITEEDAVTIVYATHIFDGCVRRGDGGLLCCLP